MITFTIDAENNISVFATQEEAAAGSTVPCDLPRPLVSLYDKRTEAATEILPTRLNPAFRTTKAGQRISFGISPPNRLAFPVVGASVRAAMQKFLNRPGAASEFRVMIR